jgi:peptidoglycan/xylan/chitin deacetylase (PgdA/CDA1 family)
MYHHINDLPSHADDAARTWTVSINNFTNQMSWLVEHGYHSIGFAQLADNLAAGAPLPDKSIIITFDDGWDVGYGTVFPILKRFKLTGTFFIYPAAIGATPGSGYMTWDQLRELASAGMDLQAHSVNHPHLRSLPPDAQWREIADAKAILEKQLGREICAFAYPFGELDQSIIELVRKAGYRCAAGIEPGFTQRTSDLFSLRRTRISYGDTLDTFAQQVTRP